MESGKLRILIFILFLFSSPVYADGGIPLWIITAPSAFSASIFPLPYLDGMWPFFLFLTTVFLIIVTLVESGVVKLFFLREVKYAKLFNIVGIANIISTLAGAIITFLPAPFWYVAERISSDTKMMLALFGYWGFLPPISLLVINVFLLWISYLIEYMYAKNKLIQDYDENTIKKSFLWANIVSYSLPIMLYGIATIFVLISIIK